MLSETILERYILGVVTAFLIAVCITPLLRELARYRSILDAPNARSSHTVPVSRLGGMAILAGTFAGGLMIISQPNRDMVAIGALSLLMVGIGLVDDLRNVSVSVKYLAQFLASVVIVLWLGAAIIIEFPFVNISLGRILSSVIAVVFIIAVVNAVNFMDGIDGIAAGIAILIALAAMMLNGFTLLGILLPLAASLAGFLCWNYNPASIFMGDGGSQLVGFILAVGLLFRPDRNVNFVPVLIVLLPILLDTGFTLLRRIARRENVFEAHREHLYQRLVASGYAHRSIATLYYVLTGASVLLAFAYKEGGPIDRTLIIIACLLVSTSFIVAVFALERGILKVSIVLPSAMRSNISQLSSEPGSEVDHAAEDD